MEEEYKIVQLTEDEVNRLAEFLKENPEHIRLCYTDSITLAVQYKNMKICSVALSRESEKWNPSRLVAVYYSVAIIFPDKIIPAKTVFSLSEHKREVYESSGDKEIDKILKDVCIFFKMYEEDTFARFINQLSDGSEDYYEYGEKYEEIRCELIHYEKKCRKNTD